MPLTRGRGSARQSMRRVIHRQGYLKKLPNPDKFGARLKKADRRWFVFGLMNLNDPYLEYYASEEDMIQNTPINIIFLDSCIGIVRERNRHRYKNAFTVVLPDRYLTLVASSRQEMADWCRSLEVQLSALGILHVNLTGENDYVDLPNVSKPLSRLSQAARSLSTESPLTTNNSLNSPSAAVTGNSQGVTMRTRSRTSTGSNRATVIGLGHAEAEGATGGCDNEDTYETLWDTVPDDQRDLYAVPSNAAQAGRDARMKELIKSSRDVQSSSHQATAETKRRKWLSSKKCAKQSLDDAVTQSLDDALTRSTDDAVTQSIDDAVTQSQSFDDNSTQSRGDDSLTQSRDDSVTQSRDVFVAESSNNSATHSLDNNVNQSPDLYVNQSCDDSVNQSRGEGINQSPDIYVNQSPDHYVNQSCDDSVKQSRGEGINQSPDHYVNQSCDDSVNQSRGEGVNQSSDEYVNQSQLNCNVINLLTPVTVTPQPPHNNTAPIQPPDYRGLHPKHRNEHLFRLGPPDNSAEAQEASRRSHARMIELLVARDARRRARERAQSSALTTPESEQQTKQKNESNKVKLQLKQNGVNKSEVIPKGARISDLSKFVPPNQDFMLRKNVGSTSHNVTNVNSSHSDKERTTHSRSKLDCNQNINKPDNEDVERFNLTANGLDFIRQPRLGETSREASIDDVTLPAAAPRGSSSSSGSDNGSVDLQVNGACYIDNLSSNNQHVPRISLTPNQQLNTSGTPATGDVMTEYQNTQLSAEPEMSKGQNQKADDWDSAPPVSGDAPPPYMPKGMLEKGANQSLKEAQVKDLERQQKCTGGVKVVIARKDCYQMIAFIECFESFWIAGWNQKARPLLSTALHIGDRVLSINGQVIDNVKLMYKLIKQTKEGDKIAFMINRIPAGKLYLFKRERDGQNLGLKRKEGTGEVCGVVLNSLAVRYGLFAAMPSVRHHSLCHPYITEINSRPLNLFYKDNEIDGLLGAVGREISLVVQPVNLIDEFKRKLKAMKDYKDYVM